MNSIKDCPFCGVEGKVHTYDLVHYFGVCENCGAEGPERVGKENAIKEWNTRTKNEKSIIIPHVTYVQGLAPGSTAMILDFLFTMKHNKHLSQEKLQVIADFLNDAKENNYPIQLTLELV